LVFKILGLAAFASAPLTFAVAHEEHQMQCNDTSINAMNADIQSMNDGEAKTTAMKEMKMAEEHFLRLRIKDDELTIYPIAIDRPPLAEGEIRLSSRSFPRRR
ncbi:MAG: hypothetical protein ACREC3_11975, partial [Methyloceanibacter sp.]